MRVTLQLPSRDGSGPWDYKIAITDSVPLPGEVIMDGQRAFQVVTRSWSIEQQSADNPPFVEVGVLIQQVGGPPVIEPISARGDIIRGSIIKP